MKLIETDLPGVVVLEPHVYEDERGFFLESYHRARFADLGIACDFVQDNHSRSMRGALRGLHFQRRFPQAKLCRVIHGEVLDVAVDIRHGSPHFGRWTSAILSAQNKRQMFVPRDFAHGFLVLSDFAEFLYKCDEFYHADDEAGIAWNDPDVQIAWNLEALGIAEPILSLKDQTNPRLRDISPDNLPVFGDLAD